MEELRSTEILDKEIQEDARKKAEKILKNADAQVAQIAASVEQRLLETKTQKEIYYKELIDSFDKDIQASVPLEKQRYAVSFQNTAMTEAIKSYLDKTDPDKKITLIGKLLKKAENALKGKKIYAVCNGFETAKIKKMLEKELGKEAVLSCKADEVNTDYEGCILETDDKSVKCRLTIQEIVDELVDEKRFELVSALFGGRLPE